MKSSGGSGTKIADRVGTERNRGMRIASITAGAAGMFCGSCLRDNTLATALTELGHDTLLLPTYTPIRTDEPDFSRGPIFFGGISVYLRQKYRWARVVPRWLWRPLDSRFVLRAVSKMAVSVRAEELGRLTVAMLQGPRGPLCAEFDSLCNWFQRTWKPDVVLLTNVLLSGVVPELKKRLNVPIVATLQGDDVFLDALPPESRSECVELIRRNCEGVDRFIATCVYYADHMASDLGLPRDRFRVVYPGIRVEKFDEVPAGPTDSARRDSPVIGYFARIAPEKGLHLLVDAFIQLRKEQALPRVRLHAGGWLGSHQRPYLEAIERKLRDAGLASDFQFLDAPTHADKVRFLRSLDVFSVPAPYREPKGLYILEAWAAGVPVVQPEHGSFPELIAMTGGGILVKPNDAVALAEGLRRLIADAELRRQMGLRAQTALKSRLTAQRMAADTVAVLEEVTGAPRVEQSIV